MNLSELFKMQKELDDYIVKTKGLEGQDLLPQKILALQVELGECANEWRGFKYWSNNQNPSSGYLIRGHGIGSPVTVSTPLLEEYIDVLHFILSIGHEEYTSVLGDTFPLKPKSFNLLVENNIKYNSIEKQFNYLFQQIGNLYDSISDHEFFTSVDVDEQYDYSLRMVIGLGEILGFTFDQIESAYHTKWKINKDRQTNGY